MSRWYFIFIKVEYASHKVMKKSSNNFKKQMSYFLIQSYLTIFAKL
ncbi:hypothetical protein B739_2070 [Riemerella anatipestifer RA-CH-1]|uniref:Uncharacterized protein n=2 Tax=Riemerella anatipestifer TaxID=34085 RepID=J9RAD5_RIEAN|nr:hypothetical protein RA0C_0260 [Riemerella anatipestifer ATCC 11845 = DSM 15868]AFR36652.1 hypothetical protein B739_2070 [Riemerella anatipestifer RA-CH-1]AIH01451.1 hypothetical protein M949_0280 [Riemerella anatipestifer CH3]AKP70358.1 hypothetical protein CG09_0056 [Riemerella anatipestifer]